MQKNRSLSVLNSEIRKLATGRKPSPIDPNIKRRALRDAYKVYALWAAEHPGKTPSTAEKKIIERNFLAAFDAGLKTNYLRKTGISALQETSASKLPFEKRLKSIGGAEGALKELDLLIQQSENKTHFFNLRSIKKETLKLLKKTRAKKGLIQKIRKSKKYYLLVQSIKSLKETQLVGCFTFYKGTRFYKIQFDSLYGIPTKTRTQSPLEIMSIESISILNPHKSSWTDFITGTHKKTTQTQKRTPF
jgi:hypothetical protein